MKLLFDQIGGIRMEYAKLCKNVTVNTIISVLDSKTKIVIWKTETEKMFDGYVYQLYDNDTYNHLYIDSINVDTISGVSILVTDKWQ